MTFNLYDSIIVPSEANFLSLRAPPTIVAVSWRTRVVDYATTAKVT